MTDPMRSDDELGGRERGRMKWDGELTQEQIDYLVGKDWYIGDDDRWHNDKTGESMERIPWLD